MADERMELNELQREWRREVSDGLKESRNQHEHTAGEIRDIRENFAKSKTVEELACKVGAMDRDRVQVLALESLALRVSALERDKAKVVGGLIILNALGGIVLWFVAKLWN
jgi:hypothetical protein